MSFAVRHFPVYARFRLFQMQGKDMTPAGNHILTFIASLFRTRILYISRIRIHPQIIRTDHADVVHCFPDRIHERIFHGFQADLNTAGGSHFRSFSEVGDETLLRLWRRNAVIDIISGYHHDPCSQIFRQLKRTFQDLHAAGAFHRIIIPQRILRQGAYAEGTYRDPGPVHAFNKAETFIFRHEDPVDFLLGGIQAHLHVIIAGSSS